MTYCPYCMTDTTRDAYVHPETGQRYCSPEHASAYSGLADSYIEATLPLDAVPTAWAWDAVPAEHLGYCVPAPDSSPFVTPLPYPTHCASCMAVLQPSDEPGQGDAVNPEFPYCRNCYRFGRAFDHVHAKFVDTLRAYGLRTSWENTGGGCWILAVTRPDAPDGYGENTIGDLDAFAPFVSVGPTVGEDDDICVESGEWQPGDTVGAYYFGTADEWDGVTDPKMIAPADAHAIARFALRNLPEVTS